MKETVDINATERLTSEADWLKSYSNQEFDDQPGHTISMLLQQFVEKGNGRDAIEIGSYPGSFLPTIGRMGYTLNGIDFNPGNATALPEWLKSKGCNVGRFFSQDFFSFVKQAGRQYQLVCSFGFIEHFKNFDEVIQLHAELVAPGGQLVITTPNFRGWLQYIPRRVFDNENLKKHYVPSMQPYVWKKLLTDWGFEIQHVGYGGGYTFWVDKTCKRSVIARFFLRLTEATLFRIKKLLLALRWESPAFSSNCIIVAKRK